MYRIAVIGAAGFTGAEVVRLVLGHPEFELVAASSDSDAGKRLAAVYPFFEGRTELTFVPHQEVLDAVGGSAGADAASAPSDIDLVFLAVPHTVSMQMAPALLAGGVSVVDLSADFRLHEAWIFEKWYGTAHTAPELIKRAVYGLPEVYREQLLAAATRRAETGEAALVANPGCYPTASTLAALPVLQAGLANAGDIVVINAISGVSGAGRASTPTTQFCLANENLNAYGAVTHRHTPEIVQTLSHIAGYKVDLQFTPHLAPVNRGMISTVAVRLSELAAEEQDAQSIWQLYADAYAEEPFVQLLGAGIMPKSASVTGGNHAQVGVAYDAYTRMVVASCAIDNLGKGAASQAVQNANIVLGLDETTGLATAGMLL
jgi:N-acetyl-gamma-glutamyl-phosphate reductase